VCTTVVRAGMHACAIARPPNSWYAQHASSSRCADA